MLYDLSKDIDISRVNKRITQLISKGSLIDLTEKKDASPSTLSYLHLLLGYLAMEVGDSIEYVKVQYYKIECNRDIFISEKEDPYLGKVRYIRSVNSLTQEEMRLSIERLRDWSSQKIGLYLPLPNEDKFIREIMTEMSKNKQYIYG